MWNTDSASVSRPLTCWFNHRIRKEREETWVVSLRTREEEREEREECFCGERSVECLRSLEKRKTQSSRENPGVAGRDPDGERAGGAAATRGRQRRSRRSVVHVVKALRHSAIDPAARVAGARRRASTARAT